MMDTLNRMFAWIDARVMLNPPQPPALPEPAPEPELTHHALFFAQGAQLNPTKADQVAIAAWRAGAIQRWLNDDDNATADPAKIQFLKLEQTMQVKSVTDTGATAPLPVKVPPKVFPPPIPVQPPIKFPFPVPIVDPKVNVEAHPIPFDPLNPYFWLINPQTGEVEDPGNWHTWPIDPKTGWPVDPISGLPVDPKTLPPIVQPPADDQTPKFITSHEDL